MIEENDVEIIEKLLFEKRYEDVRKAIPQQKKPSGSLEQQLLNSIIKEKLKLFDCILNPKKTQKIPRLSECQQNITSQYQAQNFNPFCYRLHMLGFQSFYLQCNLESSLNVRNSQQKSLVERIVELPPLNQVLKDTKTQQSIEKSLYLTVTCIQLYTKKSIMGKRHEVNKQINILFKMVEKLVGKCPFTASFCEKIWLIFTHLKIHYFSTHQQANYDEQLIWYLETILLKLTGENKLINSDTVVVLLYNIVKVLLGLQKIPVKIRERLGHLYKIFHLTNPGEAYQKNILQLFFIIKLVIFSDEELKKKNESQGNKEGNDTLFEKFSVYLNINLDETVVQLSEITRNIIRHKVASLATLITLKLGIDRFSKDFLEIMYDSPFNNEVQSIKLCFELFEVRQYGKLEYLLQSVLSVPTTKHIKQREVLLAMCGIFTGLYLEHREEGLLYAKLNHESYQANLKSGKERKQVLKEETLLQHVGFGYYNLAKHEAYLEKKVMLLKKALENFEKSHHLNSENYLLSYCMGKTYLELHDYNNAYIYSIESCKSYRGSWAPFCLLACVYLCQRKIFKALKLMEELEKKYPDVALLHYAQAYIETNKLLLEVENNEQIEAAKRLGQEYYTIHYEKILKTKTREIGSIMNHCQFYYQLKIEDGRTDPDPNFFPHLQNLMKDSSKGQQYLFPLLKIFLHLEQVNTIETLFKKIPQSAPAFYYKALLEQKKKEPKYTIKLLQSALDKDPFHCPSLIKLAILHSKTNIQKSLYYLELAGKFVNDNDFFLAKGIVLSEMGRFKQASEILLVEGDSAWVEDLPDLLYYY